MVDLDVSKNRGFSPKMDGIRVPNPIRIDDLGGQNPYFWRDTHLYFKGWSYH